MAKWILLAIALLGLTMIALGLSPLIDLWRVQALAAEHGCIVDAAGTQPCIVDGVDIGADLAARAVRSVVIFMTFGWAVIGAILVLGAMLGGLILAVRRRA